jgi:alpha-beta hydrolase superfamily lysophospholipase
MDEEILRGLARAQSALHLPPHVLGGASTLERRAAVDLEHGDRAPVPAGPSGIRVDVDLGEGAGAPEASARDLGLHLLAQMAARPRVEHEPQRFFLLPEHAVRVQSVTERWKLRVSFSSWDNPLVHRMLKRRVLPWFLAVAAAYLLVVLAFWLGQERLIYFPGPRPGPPPESSLLILGEEWIETPDGERLHGWLALPRPRPGAPAAKPAGVVLLCHGNAGNIELRLPLAEAFAEMNFATLLFDYRGYGASTGKPTEEGTYRDAEAAFDRLAGEKGFAPGRIVAFGESLGGAVAIELGLRRKLGAVVVEDTFTSMADIGAGLYPWLPVRLLVRARYDSITKIGQLEAPVLVIHSPEDDLVPFAHGEKLFAAAREPKKFLATGGRHEDRGFLREERWKADVRAFLEAIP